MQYKYGSAHLNAEPTPIAKANQIMAFKNEPIPKLDPLQHIVERIKRPPTYSQPANPSSWTIDREKNSFLVQTRGGTTDDPYMMQFALWFDGSLFDIDMERHTSGRLDAKVYIVWQLTLIRSSNNAVFDRPKILEELKNALKAYGVHGYGVSAQAIDATFDF